MLPPCYIIRFLRKLFLSFGGFVILDRYAETPSGLELNGFQLFLFVLPLLIIVREINKYQD